mgnify:CR=1 FL=1
MTRPSFSTHSLGISKNIENERGKYVAELDGLRRERDKLEHRQEKLLEAHYNDAIPLNLMKSEQQKIAKQLATIDNEVKAHECAFSAITERLKEALDLTKSRYSNHIQKNARCGLR